MNLSVRPLQDSVSAYKRANPGPFSGPHQISQLLPYLFDPSQVHITHCVDKGEYQGSSSVLCFIPHLQLYATYSCDYGSCPGCDEWEDIDQQSYDDRSQRAITQILTSARPQPYDPKEIAGIPCQGKLEDFRKSTMYYEHLVWITSFIDDKPHTELYYVPYSEESTED